MTVVTLEALETALGGPTHVSAGTVTAQYWAGSQPVTEIDGERVIFPREMRSEIVDGRPTTVLDLIPTRGVRCVRWDIKTARGTWTKIYTEIPDVDTIGIGDLVQVDPKTFEPTGEVVAAWEAVVAVVQADRERAEEAAGEAVASAVAAGESAASAEGDASSAAGSATTAVTARDEAVVAAGSAENAAGQAETSRAAAVAAQQAAERSAARAEAVPDKVDTAMAAQVGAGGEFDTKLRATIGVEVDAGTTGLVAQASESTQRLMALLATEARDAAVLFVGDSTGNEPNEWIRLLVGDLAAAHPAWTVHYRLWNNATQAYDAAETVQAGTGTRTLTIWNSSVAGATTVDQQGARARAAFYNLTIRPDLIIVSLGHNELNLTAEVWYSRMLSLTESLAWGLPEADLILVAQNPARDNDRQQKRREVYREIAARRGYGFIDVCKAFLDYPGDTTSLYADLLHPNAAGSRLWADTALAAFAYQPSLSPRSQPATPLLAAGKNLLAASDMADITAGLPNGWGALTGSVTTEIDTEHYDSFTYVNPAVGDSGANPRVIRAAKLRTAPASSGFLVTWVPIPAQGGWITYGIRAYVEPGMPNTVGRMSLYTAAGGGVNILVPNNPFGTGGFSWAFLSARIPAGVDRVRVGLYVDSASTGGKGLTVDKQFLTLGKMPIAV